MTLFLEKIAAFFAGPIGRWIVVAALLGAGLFAGGVYERDIGYREGLDVGNKQLAAQAKANALAVTALDTKYRKAEVAHKAEVTAIGASYEQKLKVSEDQRRADVAAARIGAIRLSIPAGNANTGSVPGTGGPSSEGHGAQATELPAEVGANLLDLAHDADEVVDQLNACQDIVEADRKILKGTQ